MLKKKIKVYVSHYIRGLEGNEASVETIESNLTKAKEVCKQLRIYFGSNLDFYVPAEMDEFPQVALELGFLDVEQILDIDCVIVSRCDALKLSGGMERELTTARVTGVPVYFLEDMSEANLELLKVWLENL